MSDKYRFANWGGGNDEIRKKDRIEVPSPLVLTKLFDSSAHFDQRALEKAQVIATANHCVTHISNSVAALIMLLAAPL